MMKFKNSGGKITSENIREFEQKFLLTFPDDYKSFLEKNNGGMPDGDYVFEFFDEVTEKMRVKRYANRYSKECRFLKPPYFIVFFNKFFLQVRLPALWYYIKNPENTRFSGFSL